MPQDQADAVAALIAAAVEAVDEPGAVAVALERIGVGGAAAGPLTERIHRARRERDRLRRREHELVELFSSARELAELTDVEPMLGRLVHRAHQMMGADVTYLSEFDPRTQELRVRTTSGSVSAAFQRLRVPPGRGLAGAVVESRSP